MFPTKQQAEELLKEAEKRNPGPWGNHSRTAAHCAERIAFYCADMDAEKAYVGKFDTSEEELKLIQETIKAIELDEYDKLIQLCDALSGSEGVMNMEDRMNDVRRRYGYYSQQKWDSNMALRAHFEEKMGMDLYKAVEKETFHP